MLCKKCKQQIPNDSKFCNLCGTSQTESLKKKSGGRKRGNGTGSVVKDGSSWKAIVTIGWHEVNGKLRPVRRTKQGFKTKKEALEYIPTLRNEKRKKKCTLHILYNAWSTSAMLKLSKSKQTAYKIAYKKIADIEYYNIADLTIEDLQRVIDTKATSYYTARDIKVLLSHLYKRACAQQDVLSNLAEYIVLPKLEESKQENFTEAEINQLWNAYAGGDNFIGYILLMIYSGMMPGELMKLEKSMIHLETQEIIGCGLKTKKRKETPIVIADAVIPVIQHLTELVEGDKILPYDKDMFYSEYHAALSRAGVRNLDPYSCRHTTATALALGNIAPSVIQEVMRHSKITTTQRYIHVDTAPMLQAVNQISDVKKKKIS